MTQAHSFTSVLCYLLLLSVIHMPLSKAVCFYHRRVYPQMQADAKMYAPEQTQFWIVFIFFFLSVSFFSFSFSFFFVEYII